MHVCSRNNICGRINISMCIQIRELVHRVRNSSIFCAQISNHSIIDINAWLFLILFYIFPYYSLNCDIKRIKLEKKIEVFKNHCHWHLYKEWFIKVSQFIKTIICMKSTFIFCVDIFLIFELFLMGFLFFLHLYWPF